MEAKLLKKIRKRFKVVHNQVPEREMFKILGIKQALVYDKKEGIQPELMDYTSRFSIGHMVYIDSPSLAEYLTILVLGISYVYRHRQHVHKRRNRSFVKANF